jgi:hypothetical protein
MLSQVPKRDLGHPELLQQYAVKDLIVGNINIQVKGLA